MSAPGWLSSTQRPLTYQFFQMANDGSLTALGTSSGLATQAYQLAQVGTTLSSVTVVLVVQDTTGASSAASAQVLVNPNPKSLLGDVVNFLNLLLATSVTSASQTSNNVQLFASLNQYKDTLDASLLAGNTSSSNSSSHARRLLSYTAASVASLQTQTGTQLGVVASNAKQVDVQTAINAALKQTVEPSTLSVDAVQSSGLLLLASLSLTAKSISTASANGQAAALQATQSLLQFAQQQLAAVMLNLSSNSGAPLDPSIQPTVQALLSNISAQGAVLSLNGLTVAGQSYSFAGSSLTAVVSRAAVTDTYTYTAADSSAVSFPGGAMAGTASVDGTVTLGNTSSSLLDTQVWYMPVSPYLWTLNTSTILLSSVLAFTRLTTNALQFGTAISATQPTAMLSLTFNSSSVPSGFQPACALWDGSSASWRVNTPYLTIGSATSTNVTGQSVVTCDVLSLSAATVSLVAQNMSISGAGTYPSSSSSSTVSFATSQSLSSRSSTAAQPSSTGVRSWSLSSSSVASMAASSTGVQTASLLYPAGSVRLTLVVDVDTIGGLVGMTVLAMELREDIALNFALLLNSTEEELLPFVVIVGLNGSSPSTTIGSGSSGSSNSVSSSSSTSASVSNISVMSSSSGGSNSRRRLLSSTQSSIPVSFVLLSNVSSLVAPNTNTAVNPSSLVAMFVAAAQQHTLVTRFSNATIPQQTPATADANGATDSSSSSSSTGQSSGPMSSSSSNVSLIVGLVVGLCLGVCIAVVLVTVAVLRARGRIDKVIAPTLVAGRTAASSSQSAAPGHAAPQQHVVVVHKKQTWQEQSETE